MSKTVIEMALKAGFLSRDNSSAMYSESDFDGEICMEEYAVGERLKRFAELVRADERNRTSTQEHWTEYERSIAAQEREACAKVCDEQAERSKRAMEKSKRTTDHAVYRAGAQTAAWNAAAIRARSNT